MRIAIACLLLAACHGAPPPAAPVAPVATCAKVADHLVSVMSASKKVDNTQLDPIRNTLTSHCDQDKWTADAQQCLLSVASVAEIDQCKTQFTDAQNQAMEGANRKESALDQGAAPGGEAIGGGAQAPASTGAAPPAATAPRSPKKGSKQPKTGGDPCEGGE